LPFDEVGCLTGVLLDDDEAVVALDHLLDLLDLMPRLEREMPCV
jgi:hypothetical protein